jgi:hypothetical protein
MITGFTIQLRHLLMFDVREHPTPSRKTDCSAPDLCPPLAYDYVGLVGPPAPVVAVAVASACRAPIGQRGASAAV